MLRVILIAILLLVVARLLSRLVAAIVAGARPQGSEHPAVKLVRDPVCGTYVRPRAALSLTASGSTHYFCSEQCRATYRKGADA